MNFRDFLLFFHFFITFYRPKFSYAKIRPVFAKTGRGNEMKSFAFRELACAVN